MVANNARTLNLCTKGEQLLWYLPTAAAKTSDARFLYSFSFIIVQWYLQIKIPIS